jgi:transposase
MVSIGRGSHRNRCDGPFGWGELTDLYGETGSDPVIWSMPLRPEDVPSDPARLVAMVLALDTENERLRAIVRTLKDLLFGARSERAAVIDVAQLPLDLDDLAVGPTPPPPPANDEGGTERKLKRPRRPALRNIGALPKHLPRCEEVIEPETTVCPCCSGALHRIGEETREALDVVPAFVRVKRTIFPKYACRTCEGAIVQAKSPPRLVEGGMATTALVTHVAVSKFAWHIPLYRQAQIFAGQGVRLDRSTLALWMKRAAWWLKPLYERQLAAILAGSRVFSDETPMPVLDPGRGRTKCGQFWSHAVDDRPWGGPAPPAVAYVYAEGRSMADLASQVQGFAGILQVDGYGSYKGLARRHPQIQLAFCLAHTIRTQSRFDDRACFGAGGGTAQGDDMLDLQCVVMDDDALDDQLQNGLAFDYARSVQSRLDPFTERGQARQRFLGLNALLA